jgi:hypothetical protein
MGVMSPSPRVDEHSGWYGHIGTPQLGGGGATPQMGGSTPQLTTAEVLPELRRAGGSPSPYIRWTTPAWSPLPYYGDAARGISAGGQGDPAGSFAFDTAPSQLKRATSGDGGNAALATEQPGRAGGTDPITLVPRTTSIEDICKENKDSSQAIGALPCDTDGPWLPDTPVASVTAAGASPRKRPASSKTPRSKTAKVKVKAEPGSRAAKLTAKVKAEPGSRAAKLTSPKNKAAKASTPKAKRALPSSSSRTPATAKRPKGAAADQKSCEERSNQGGDVLPPLPGAAQVHGHLRLPADSPFEDDPLPASITEQRSILSFVATDAAGAELQAQTTFVYRRDKNIRATTVSDGNIIVSLSTGMRLFESHTRHKLQLVRISFKDASGEEVARVVIAQSSRDENYKAFSMAFSERSNDIALLVKFSSISHTDSEPKRRKRRGAYQRTLRVQIDAKPGVSVARRCNGKPLLLFSDVDS